MAKKSDSFVVTVKNDEYNVIDSLELNKHALKADVDYDGSKQVIDKQFKQGTTILDPKYNPYDLVQLLDLYTYHAAAVDAVAVDARNRADNGSIRHEKIDVARMRERVPESENSFAVDCGNGARRAERKVTVNNRNAERTAGFQRRIKPHAAFRGSSRRVESLQTERI